MKFSEWLDFNDPFLNCDFLVRVIKIGSMNTRDVLFETVCSRNVAKRFFGELTMKSLGIDHYPDSENPCFNVILWADEC